MSPPVDWNSDEPVDADDAERAARAMTVRLVQTGHTGSEAVVNADGTGLEITVAGAATDAEANAIVEPLTIIGTVWFRPVIEGPLPPAADETPSEYTPEIVGTGTTLPADDQPTTPPSEDNPEGTVLLAQPDPRDDSVVARYEVGPAQVSGTTVVGTEVTTLEGYNAVKIVFEETADGLTAFNTLAESCKSEAATCPAGIYAVTYDGWVATVSTVQPSSDTFTPFTQENVIVASPLWTSDFARLLAVVIESGSLPVGLSPAA